MGEKEVGVKVGVQPLQLPQVISNQEMPLSFSVSDT